MLRGIDVSQHTELEAIFEERRSVMMPSVATIASKFSIFRHSLQSSKRAPRDGESGQMLDRLHLQMLDRHLDDPTSVVMLGKRRLRGHHGRRGSNPRVDGSAQSCEAVLPPTSSSQRPFATFHSSRRPSHASSI